VENYGDGIIAYSTMELINDLIAENFYAVNVNVVKRFSVGTVLEQVLPFPKNPLRRDQRGEDQEHPPGAPQVSAFGVV